MRKFLSLVLALVMMLSLGACSSDAKDTTQSTQSDSSEEETAVAEETYPRVVR